MNRETEEHESRFAVRMAWIVGDSTERIAEHGKRFIESYTVLSPIRGLLSGVPFEDRGYDGARYRIAVGGQADRDSAA